MQSNVIIFLVINSRFYENTGGIQMDLLIAVHSLFTTDHLICMNYQKYTFCFA